MTRIGHLPHNLKRPLIVPCRNILSLIKQKNQIIKPHLIELYPLPHGLHDVHPSKVYVEKIHNSRRHSVQGEMTYRPRTSILNRLFISWKELCDHVHVKLPF